MIAGSISPSDAEKEDLSVAIRTLCAALIITSLSTAALAQQPDAIDACAQVKDPTARLACFDRATATRRAAQPTAPPAAGTGATAPATSKAPPAAASAADRDVGLDARTLSKERKARGEPKPPPPAPIVARLVKVIPRQPQINAFELDNGQIWEQSESMDIRAEPQQQVTIKHGVMNAFFLKTADGVVVRVHRVK
jgi:hypothetical protein